MLEQLNQGQSELICRPRIVLTCRCWTSRPSRAPITVFVFPTSIPATWAPFYPALDEGVQPAPELDAHLSGEMACSDAMTMFRESLHRQRGGLA